MRLALYVVLGFATTVVAGYLIAVAQTHGGGTVMGAAFVALFVIPSMGALWMMYMSVRYENSPLGMVLLAAFVPFAFLWYYFERVRRRNLHKNRGECISDPG